MLKVLKMMGVYFYHIIFCFISVFIKKEKRKTILLINYNNLGDLVCDTPSLRSLRNFYKNEQIIMLVKNKASMDFLSYCPYIDKIIEMPHSRDSLKKFFKFALKFKRINFLLSIQFVRPFDQMYRTMLPFILNIKQRLGLKQLDKKYRYLGSFTTSIKLDNTSSRIEESLNLIKKLNIPILGTHTECWYNENDVKHKITNDYIVIQTQATMQARIWHKSNYAELINLITAKYHDLKIVLTGTEKESLIINEIKSKCQKTELVYIYDDLSISNLLYIIKHSKLLITNDTGPLHFAHAFNIPTIAIFGISPPEYLYPSSFNYHYIKGIRHCPADCQFRSAECFSIYKHNIKDLPCINTVNINDVFNLFQLLYS